MNTQELNTKFNNWLEKAQSGDKKFTLLTKTSDNLWYLVSNNRAEPIKSLRVSADFGSGLQPIYSFDQGASEAGEFQSIVVVKNDEKMLVSDGNEISAYGIEGAKASARVLFIYLRTCNIHNILLAHEKACKVNVIFDYAVEDNDALWICVSDMFAKPNSDHDRRGGQAEDHF